jgi:release factor glutamine methyltransferase
MSNPLELVRSGEEALLAHGVPEARLDSELLLSHLLRCRRLDLYLNRAGFGDPSIEKRFKRLISRRGRDEPIPYLTGEAIFLSRRFSVGPGVLIPRFDTEVAVHEALSHLTAGPFLELGTGSGCIAVSLLLERPECPEGYATEISSLAMAYARINSETYGLAGRLHLLPGDLFRPLPERLANRFELVVSNPPYIDLDADPVEPSVLAYEPRLALDGGKGGFDFYRRILDQGGAWLKDGGTLVLEIGRNQRKGLENLMRTRPNWQLEKITEDEGGNERVLTLRYRKNFHG